MIKIVNEVCAKRVKESFFVRKKINLTSTFFQELIREINLEVLKYTDLKIEESSNYIIHNQFEHTWTIFKNLGMDQDVEEEILNQLKTVK